MSSHARKAREAFGARLRDIRKDAGLTGRALAQRVGWHYTKVSRIEHGGQGLSDADIRAWCAACGADDQVADLIAEARAVESAYQEWKRQARTGLRRMQESSIPLYERTRLFRVYEHNVLPGLFHTAAYAGELFGHWVRLLDIPDDREAATQARLARQRVLHTGDHRFVFLLAEQTLRTRVGSAETMIEQLDHLLEVMRLPRVCVGIVPVTAPFQARAQTAFWMFDEALVRVETLTASVEITRPSEIALYVTVFEHIRRAAKFGTAAREMVVQARDQLLQHPATS